MKEVSNSEKYQHMDIILKKNILEKKVAMFLLKKTNFSCRVGGAYSRGGGGGALFVETICRGGGGRLFEGGRLIEEIRYIKKKKK